MCVLCVCVFVFLNLYTVHSVCGSSFPRVLSSSKFKGYKTEKNEGGGHTDPRVYGRVKPEKAMVSTKNSATFSLLNLQER